MGGKLKRQLLLQMGAYSLAQLKLRKRESAHFSSIYIYATHTHTFISVIMTDSSCMAETNTTL